MLHYLFVMLLKTLQPYATFVSINGYQEAIFKRSSLPRTKCHDIFRNRTIATLGYGPQGRNQSLNLRDNGFNVILGLRKGPSWSKAVSDGWSPGIDLFDTDEATYKGDVIQYLLSDAGQIQMWPVVKRNLKQGKTLYFSHGFGIVFSDQTGIVPPAEVDVILAAPKGPGGMLRDKYVKSNYASGINTSIAVHQNASGNAELDALALGFGIGSLNIFETTFDREVYSDLTGERCVLMGMIQGAFKAQYDVLRSRGHSPIEAFNETVEEALVSLYPIINEKGMDWMYKNCSTTAQRGAIDWSKHFYSLIRPSIERCYDDVVNGKETRRVIYCNKNPEYRRQLENELNQIDDQEIWKTAKIVRELR